jgi:hypothetical protein
LTNIKFAASELTYFCEPFWNSEACPMPTSTPGLEPIPMMQRILDNPFLLLFLGVTIPTVLYVIWGVMEVASVPLAK